MADRVQVRAFWVVRSGRRQSVWLSEAAARHQIAARRDSASGDPTQWTVETEDLELPVVGAARVFDAPDGETHHWHAAWQCPHCSREHVTDIESLPALRGLWFCERGEGLTVVTWSHPPLGT